MPRDQPIFCFDVDGTLVDEQGVIHPADVALLGAEPPAALFIPCTGHAGRTAAHLCTVWAVREQ